MRSQVVLLRKLSGALDRSTLAPAYEIMKEIAQRNTRNQDHDRNRGPEASPALNRDSLSQRGPATGTIICACRVPGLTIKAPQCLIPPGSHVRPFLVESRWPWLLLGSRHEPPTLVIA